MSNVYITTVQYPNILATTLGVDTAHYIEVSRPPAGLLIVQASFFKLTSQASHALKLLYIQRQFVNYYLYSLFLARSLSVRVISSFLTWVLLVFVCVFSFIREKIRLIGFKRLNRVEPICLWPI
jgi:hypothetical protein